VSPEQISAVYWRRVVKMLDSPMLGLPTTANLDQYEMFWSLRWVLEALPASRFPLGHPYAHGPAENKHRQLETARQVGLATPETCHSNNLEDLRRFIAAQKEIAVKAMRIPALTKSGIYENVRHIACKAFTPDFLLAKLRTVEATQLYCQQVIQRKRDLRIMVFPHELVAVELDLSGLTPDKLDWREESLELPHRVVSVPPEFERQLRAYLDQMGLTTGFFDFAVPEEGPPVFFECNTNAQWYWIEKVTSHPISEVIARELVATVDND
jgi:hypothetical protein